MAYRIAVDVGGTFTDVVCVGDTGGPTFVKVPSTPENQATGVMNGLERLADALMIDLPKLLSETVRIVHGMTVATNALLERKGAKVGLLTTAGHRDVLEMREGLKPERYNMRLPRAEPLVPRHLRLGVRERLRADGTVEAPLDNASLEMAIDQLKAEQVTSVAVCYLHAYRDAQHEKETARVIGQLMPEVSISLSSDVHPQIKEFERVSTTVVNAYVAPAISHYLEKLELRLAEAGFAGPLLIMLSHGGVAPVAEAIRVAAATVLSGPAGGIAAGRRISAMLGAPNLITFDVGGTSSDISLITNGRGALSSDRTLANERIALQSLDIITLGAGGGSIARLESNGLLEVGPQSAGSVPGPACYGRGGTRPTVTDASVVLGYLDPNNFAGGKAKLDQPAAHAALEQLGLEIGVSAVEAAEGVHRVVNTQLAEGIRVATVRRGVDPRRFGLLGFGGAAGVHVTELARMLEIRRVIIPNMASVLSAWGMLNSELRLESVRTLVDDINTIDANALGKLFADMETEGIARMNEWFDGEVETSRAGEMRYGEQIFEIDVALGTIDFGATGALQDLKTAFETRHQDLYGYHLPEEAPVVVNARVATVGRLDAPSFPEKDVNRSTASKPHTARRLYLDGWIEVPVYEFDDLPPASTVIGPAIVESDTTTVLLRAEDAASATSQGWLDIRIQS